MSPNVARNMGQILSATAGPAKPSQVLALDTVDDRREVRTLLSRLPPWKRLAFMDWACAQSRLPHAVQRPRVTQHTRALAEQARTDSGADERLTLELYFDVWNLGSAFAVDFDRVVRRLERLAR